MAVSYHCVVSLGDVDLTRWLGGRLIRYREKNYWFGSDAVLSHQAAVPVSPPRAESWNSGLGRVF